MEVYLVNPLLWDHFPTQYIVSVFYANKASSGWMSIRSTNFLAQFIQTESTVRIVLDFPYIYSTELEQRISLQLIYVRRKTS